MLVARHYPCASLVATPRVPRQPSSYREATCACKEDEALSQLTEDLGLTVTCSFCTFCLGRAGLSLLTVHDRVLISCAHLSAGVPQFPAGFQSSGNGNGNGNGNGWEPMPHVV